MHDAMPHTRANRTVNCLYHFLTLCIFKYETLSREKVATPFRVFRWACLHAHRWPRGVLVCARDVDIDRDDCDSNLKYDMGSTKQCTIYRFEQAVHAKIPQNL